MLEALSNDQAKQLAKTLHEEFKVASEADFDSVRQGTRYETHLPYKDVNFVKVYTPMYRSGSALLVLDSGKEYVEKVLGRLKDKGLIAGVREIHSMGGYGDWTGFQINKADATWSNSQCRMQRKNRQTKRVGPMTKQAQVKPGRSGLRSKKPGRKAVPENTAF